MSAHHNMDWIKVFDHNEMLDCVLDKMLDDMHDEMNDEPAEVLDLGSSRFKSYTGEESDGESLGGLSLDPSMTGRVMVVTGADSGIGYHVAQRLAEYGNDVVLACRSRDKGEEAVRRVKEAHPNALATFMELDLTSTTSIKNFVRELEVKKRKCHALIHNAALKLNDNDYTFRTTIEKVEVTMSTNHIGPLILTKMLEQMIITAGQRTGDARIVFLTCGDHNTAVGGTDPLTIKNMQLQQEGSFNGKQAYKNSKLCSVMATYYLARQMEPVAGVTVNVINPGKCPMTNLDRHSSKFHQTMRKVFGHFLCRCFTKTKSKKTAARYVVDLATSDKYKGKNGKYFEDGVEQRSSVESYDTSLQEAMWAESMRIGGMKTIEERMDEISISLRVNHNNQINYM